MLKKAKNATIVGNVDFSENVNIWYGASFEQTPVL
jgi:hypothetical protein